MFGFCFKALKQRIITDDELHGVNETIRYYKTGIKNFKYTKYVETTIVTQMADCGGRHRWKRQS